MRRKTLWPTAWLALALLPGCSTIKSWFPDKERDYQFTTEIPELVVPEDLKQKGLAAVAEPVPRAQPVASIAQTETAQEPQIQAPVAPEVAKQAKPQTQPVEDSIVHPGVGTNISSLQIDQPQLQASRLVAKALSRQKLEIVERNVDKGYFYVKFDPNAVKAKDESIWDELNFLFGEDPSQEEEFRITVHELSPQMSEVTVQDSSGKTLSNAAANALLRLMTEAINETLNQPDADPAAVQE